MKMLARAAVGLSALFACAPVMAQNGPLPASCARADGAYVACSPAVGIMAPATSTPQEGTVTSSAATATSGSATFSSGTAYIGPLTPVLGRDIRVILKGTWVGTLQIGTASAANGCTAGNINPLTVGGGQPWGKYTTNANEVVDTPTLGATPAGTLAPVYCAIATITSGTLTYGVRQ